jgi:uncharacterized RDD family membrane protein YckC
LDLRPAGLSVRYYAFILDWAIRLAALFAAAIVAGAAGGIGVAFWLILAFALEWLYPMAFELTRSGATPGKRFFGLRVVMDNGLPVTAGASVTRNLLRVADFLPFGYGFALVSVLFRGDAKRLGDLAAGTLVIHAPRPAGRVVLGDIQPVIPARLLSQDDQAALVALAARAPALTAARVDELAAIAAAVSNDTGRSGHDVTRRVLGVAQWALGRRP